VRHAGQIAVLRFPLTDLTRGKARPVLLLAPVPGPYEDWLIAMISTQLQHAVEGFDEILDPREPDFQQSGLKLASVIRVGRLAVVGADVLLGAIGEINSGRLRRICQNIATWVQGAIPVSQS